VAHSECKVDKPFGLWGVTNGIGANLRSHGRVLVRAPLCVCWYVGPTRTLVPLREGVCM